MAIRRVQDPATNEWFDMDDGLPGQDDGDGDPAPPAKTPAQYAADRADRRNSNAEKIKAQEKEIAFLKAGINPDTSPLRRDFFRAYDGELTVEAVKKAAEERGFVEIPDTPPPAAQQGSPVQPGNTGRAPTSEELQQMAAQAAGRIAGASQGADSSYANDMQKLQAAAASGDENAMMQVLRQAGVAILQDGTPVQ